MIYHNRALIRHVHAPMLQANQTSPQRCQAILRISGGGARGSSPGSWTVQLSEANCWFKNKTMDAVQMGNLTSCWSIFRIKVIKLYQIKMFRKNIVFDFLRFVQILEPAAGTKIPLISSIHLEHLITRLPQQLLKWSCQS